MPRIIGPFIAAAVVAVGLLLAILSGYIPNVFPNFVREHPVRFWGSVGILVGVLVGYAFFEARHQASKNEPAIDQQEVQRNQQRLQDDTLRIYLDQMTELLLNRGLRTSALGAEVRDIARIHTLTALRRLDADRRAIVMHFLRNSKLVGLEDSQKIVNFDRADLSNADLRIQLEGISLKHSNFYGANLTVANLEAVDLEGAVLQRANLERAILRGAILTGANLEAVDLEGANLFMATLFHANLAGVNLAKTAISYAQLKETASLSGVILPNGETYEPGDESRWETSVVHLKNK